MKRVTLKLGLVALIVLGFISCKNKEKEIADERISELEEYIDSLKIIDEAEIRDNWEQIAVIYDKKSINALDAMLPLNDEDKNFAQTRIDNSDIIYEEIKSNAEMKDAVINPLVKISVNQQLRDRLFGAGKIGEDVGFLWVNKDNILKTYETFFQSFKDNKDDFSREDYDEIKLMYEALDNRKNTVEKEGLTTADNNSIALIKVKFGHCLK